MSCAFNFADVLLMHCISSYTRNFNFPVYLGKLNTVKIIHEKIFVNVTDMFNVNTTLLCMSRKQMLFKVIL